MFTVGKPESFIWPQVVELKVGMHCERCIKAIKKAIKTIDGKPTVNSILSIPQKSFTLSSCIINHAYQSCTYVHADMESYHLETEINKVTVTGNVTPEEVVKALHKIGKTATSWAED